MGRASPRPPLAPVRRDRAARCVCCQNAHWALRDEYTREKTFRIELELELERLLARQRLRNRSALSRQPMRTVG